MVLLFSDYGLEGPYIGQVISVLHQQAADEAVVNLMSDAPRNNPKASAYLLASLTKHIPEDSIVFCVVDPGVGTGRDLPIVIHLDNRWYVGPDNGLFDLVLRRKNNAECWQIDWQPENLSNSFHGRDLYAPVCAMLANGKQVPGQRFQWQDRHLWPDDLMEVIYIDHFGNAMTGVRSASIEHSCSLLIRDESVSHARTFSEVEQGSHFWYVNSNGLVEISVNQGSARQNLGLQIGTTFKIL